MCAPTAPRYAFPREEDGRVVLLDTEQAPGAGRPVGEEGAGRSARATRPAVEGDVAVQRRGFGAELGGVGEQVVGEMLDGLPAGPLQCAGPGVPVGAEGGPQGGERQPNGVLHVVGGNGCSRRSL